MKLSKEDFHKLMEKLDEEGRPILLGDKNPMWKGDKASPHSGRQRSRRKLERFGIDIEGLDVHHIDGNPFNNEPDNLQPITRKEHMVADGRIDKLIERNKNTMSEKKAEYLFRTKHKGMSGKKLTPEQCKKISEAKKLLYKDHPERNPMYGRPKPPRSKKVNT